MREWRARGNLIEINDGPGWYLPFLEFDKVGVRERFERSRSWCNEAQFAQANNPRVPLIWVLGTIYAESGGDPNAVSPVGAMGLMQVMPSTAEGLGFDSRMMFSPISNIEAGTKLQSQFLAQGYQLPQIASMYNAGPSAKGGPKKSLTSPWGMVENKGYISTVVAASNSFALALKNAPSTGSVLPFIAVGVGLALLFGGNHGRKAG